LARIPEGRRVNIERETFPAMVAEGTLFGLADPAYWLDVGTPERLLQANLDVLDGLRPTVETDAAETAEIDPGADVRLSLLGEHVTVDGTATVVRSVLSRGVWIAEGAVVEDALLLPGSSVGPGAAVRRSLMGADAAVQAGASIGDVTVLGDGVRVEAGTVLVSARVPDEG
ncbi:MAG: NDP-sugar synthase, partial [Acidimicrobiales bacterium]